jgi:hypothetical protein
MDVELLSVSLSCHYCFCCLICVDTCILSKPNVLRLSYGKCGELEKALCLLNFGKHKNMLKSKALIFLLRKKPMLQCELKCSNSDLTHTHTLV